MDRWFLLATAAFFVFADNAQASTPAISTVSGTVTTGQTLTVTGSSLWNQVTTSWDPFFDASTSGFEGSSPTADGYADGGCGAGLSYDTSVKLLGSKSIKMHDSGFNDVDNKGQCPFDYVIQAAAGTGSADVYYRTYSRWDNTSWPTIDHKYWWLGGGTTYAFVNFNPTGTGSAPTQWGFLSSGLNGGAFNWYDIPGGAIQNNRWYLLEFHFRRAGTGSYVFEGWIDNQLVFSETSTDGPAANPGGWGWESNSNYWDTPIGWSSDQWQDGFVVSGTRVGPASLVEIGNASDYASATKVYQSPSSIADGMVSVTANLSGLGTGPYWLWVTNDNGERSVAYALGGSDTTPPAAPTGLGVQ
ncbi:MAG: hypothetical protein WBO92_02585 [Candidatus Moraniibacteriota bacterium]